MKGIILPQLPSEGMQSPDQAKFADSRRQKTKQLVNEAEALFAKAALRLSQDDQAGMRFKETEALLKQAYSKYESVVRVAAFPSVQLQQIHCLIQWSNLLINQGEELLTVTGKKLDKFSRANRSNAVSYITDAIRKYENVLERIEAMKDEAAEDESDYELNDEESALLDEHQYSTLLQLGRAQSVRGVNLLTEADITANMKDAKAHRKEALFLFKQSYNHFAECLTFNSQNHHALRYWGSALCKEAYTLKLLHQDTDDPMRLVTEGGEKLYLAYRMAPTDPANRRSLARFFYEQGAYQLAESAKIEEKSVLATADCLLQKALQFSHPEPTPELLQTCADLALQASGRIVTPALSDYLKQLAEEYSALAPWVISKNFARLNNGNLRRFGFLTKKGKVVSSWKRRFFILTTKNLSYYPKPDSKCLGTIPLREVQEVEEDGTDRDFCLGITTIHRRYLLQADDEQQVYEWIESIRAAASGMPAPSPLL